ncbi:MAG: glycosyltransferase, partial [Chlorobia bacterium]|nr:glycosyltransferase [Fimbriimonadaceae bacterium]
VFVLIDVPPAPTPAAAGGAGAWVVTLHANRGRGAARARAIMETDADLLLSVDGTSALAVDFLELTSPWFEDPKVAAVYGRIGQLPPKGAVDRWRGRHLYKLEERHEPQFVQSLASGGGLLRRSAILEVGNFDASLRHSEDFDLGERLFAAGWKIVYEPRARLTTLVSNSLLQVFERYWRWHAGVNPKFGLSGYLRHWWYSVKVIAAEDIRSGDLACAAMTLFLPHYCAWRSLGLRAGKTSGLAEIGITERGAIEDTRSDGRS